MIKLDIGLITCLLIIPGTIGYVEYSDNDII